MSSIPLERDPAGEHTVAETRSRFAGWALFAVLLIAQWTLFRQFALREIVWAYPAFHDQAAFLHRSYAAHETILSKGLITGLWHTLREPAVSGVMLPLQASLLFLLIGASRLSALTLNFLYFTLLQLALVWTLQWLSGRWSISFLGLGLLLSAATPFYWAGGLMDFRLDFIAVCLFGIFICAVIRSRIFASPWLSAAAGFVAALLGLFRFIAFVYVLGILVAFLGLVIIRWRLRPRPARQPLGRQLSGIAIAATILTAAVVPALWTNREYVKSYYVVGHLTGEEKHLRAREQGLFSLKDHVAWYPRSLLRDHAGPVFIWVSSIALVASLVRRVRYRSADGRAPFTLRTDGAWSFLALSFLVPLLILTVDVAKSPVVADILVPSLLWLVVLAVTSVWGDPRTQRLPPAESAALTALGVFAVALGLYNQVDHLGRHGRFSPNRPDVEQVVRLYDLIGEHSRRMQWPSIVISTDSMSESLNAFIVTPMVYERQGVLLPARAALGGSIFAVTEPAAVSLLEGSHFVILTTRGLPERPTFPLDESVRAFHPRLQEYCERSLLPLGRFRSADRDVTLYARPGLVMEGDSGGWITSAGLTLSDPGSVLRFRPKVAVRGQSNFAFLKTLPSPRAELRLADGTTRAIPAAMASSGSDYCISLDAGGGLPAASRAAAKEPPAVISVSFDSYFVPKQLGINEDTRKLVISTPQEVTVHAVHEQGICAPPTR